MYTDTSLSNTRTNSRFQGLLQPLGIGLFLILMPMVIRFLDGEALLLWAGSTLASIESHPHGVLFSAVIYFLVGGGLIGIGVPRLWVSAGAGAVFTPFPGTLVALGASLLGASALFMVARKFLSSAKWPFLEKRLGSCRRAFQSKAFIWVLYARLFPFSNSTTVSLFCGYCKIDFISYLAGSLIGFFPLTLIVCLFGGGCVSAKRSYLVLGVILIVLLHLLTRLTKTRLHISNSSNTEKRTPHASHKK